MKRFLCTVLALLLVISSLPISVFATANDNFNTVAKEAIIASGYCGGKGDGTNLTWLLDSNGTLTISGKGKMDNFASGLPPWSKYFEQITAVILNEGVENIGFAAFSECNIESVSIPNSVTTIGCHAFEWCEKLISINLPNSITIIDDLAFSGCLSLSSVNIPDSVVYIGERAFISCDIKSITIPENVSYIGSRAFLAYDDFTSINVDERNPYYSSLDGVLYNSDKTSLICCPNGKNGQFSIPDSVTCISEYAFNYCEKLKSITIPEGVVTIERNAFDNCSMIDSIIIPNGVTSIGHEAFIFCSSLTSIIIPDSVTSIGIDAFDSIIDNPNITIYGYDGSYAESYAKENNIPFSVFLGTHSVTLPFTDSSMGIDTQITFDWNLKSLIDIQGRNRSIEIAGLLLSSAAYNGNNSSDSVASVLEALNLLGGKTYYSEINDKSRLFVNVQTVVYNGEIYNIITAVARGTSADFTDIVSDASMIGFNLRSDQLIALMRKALDENNIVLTHANNRFFLTGHSLGGATVNITADKLLDSGVSPSNVICYGYATPFTNVTGGHEDCYIYNIIDSKDPVPFVGQNSSEPGYAIGGKRYGKDIILSRGEKFRNAYYWAAGQRNWEEIPYPWEGSTAANLAIAGLAQVLKKDSFYYHHCGIYLCHILADHQFLFNATPRKHIGILCPVNVSVIDENNNIVASVENNEVVVSGNEDVVIAVLGDQKYIDMPRDVSYHIELTGTEYGKLAYVVEDVEYTDGGRNVSSQSVSENVQIFPEKKMKSDIVADNPTITIRTVNESGETLNLIDHNGNETPVSEERHSHYGKWVAGENGLEEIYCEFCGEMFGTKEHSLEPLDTGFVEVEGENAFESNSVGQKAVIILIVLAVSFVAMVIVEKRVKKVR